MSKKNKKYSKGKECVIDEGMPWEVSGVIRSPVLSDKFGKWIIVGVEAEVWNHFSWPKTFIHEFRIRSPLERVTLRS